MDYSYGNSHQRSQIRELQQRLKLRDKARSSARRRTKGRTQDVEEDLAFLTLFTRALLDILVTKELCTIEEVGERMRDLDLLDGEADHGLDTKTLASELGVEKPEVDEKKRFAESVRKSRKRKKS